MHEQRRERTDLRADARGLARRFEARAWDLVEQPTHTPLERAEMLDAARAARALVRIATGATDGIPMLRAHQLVAFAAWRANDPPAAFEAARLARGCEWIAPNDVTPTDEAMTLAAEYLAGLTRPGFTDPVPLMARVRTLPRIARDRLERILPWPAERFAGSEPVLSPA